jgi:GxxExxY protein
MANHRGRESAEVPDVHLTHGVIGAALRVHRELGPGLLESIYESCLFGELIEAGILARRQVELPVEFRGRLLPESFRLDLLIEDRLIVEVKAVERIHAVHRAQLLTYLKLSGLRLGLLINFNVEMLRNGVHRIIRSVR